MKVALAPLDTWFFRDGTPFDMDASSQAGVASMFPPYPPTVAGALRAGLARLQGWDGRSSWSANAKIVEILGDGPHQLGRLRFTGPFLFDGAAGMLFPLPRHVVGVKNEGQWTPKAMLRPGATVVCDLDKHVGVRLAQADWDPAEPLVAGERLWVTSEGFQRILRAELPRTSDLLRECLLWTEEPRVGIARDLTARTVTEGNLYSTRHVRLKSSVRIGIEITGLPEDWCLPTILPFGGENRLAACEEWTGDVRFDIGGSLDASSYVVLIALTPLLLERDVFLGYRDLPIEGGARIICAVAEGPARIGGWDSLSRTPLPLKRAIVPGSVLFCEIRNPVRFQASIESGLLRLGDAVAVGFGLCAIGRTCMMEDQAV